MVALKPFMVQPIFVKFVVTFGCTNHALNCPLSYQSILFTPIHPLTLIVRPPSLAGFFVCDGCRDMSPGFAFHCKACRFNLDVKCAISTDGEDLRSRKGPAYGCLDCEFYLHES
ncbi:hypothetical protein H0E87_031023 [Populus deltoides]|uniref:DC1 domain-containing protein n=1 Tax=Populus deltoides TaxID=3696 RepID=A0A8T2WMN4_POPDE|nr:hypothetical protein H0E87_031023 [Populus deltoides]